MHRSIITICCTFAFAATAGAQPDSWKEYVYAEDGFAVSAPAEPVFETQPIYVVGGTANAHIYTVPASEHGIFMLFIFQRHPSDRRPDKQLHEQAQQGVLALAKGQPRARSQQVLGNYRGAELQFETQHPELERTSHEVRSRYYVVGRRIYHLMAIVPAGESFPAETDRWFKSFRVVNASQRTR